MKDLNIAQKVCRGIILLELLLFFVPWLSLIPVFGPFIFGEEFSRSGWGYSFLAMVTILPTIVVTLVVDSISKRLQTKD